MHVFHAELWQWLLAGAAGLFVGISKTGMPGAGILVVPLLAYAFGGPQSVGIMLPMLICGDVFAVAWYRRHAQWDKLIRLFPWVVVGMVVGSAGLWFVGESQSKKDILGIAIGYLVLIMLALHLLRNRLGDRLTPRSKAGVAVTGTAAGFATTVSNAAGPIMQMYMAAQDMPKEQFMGTIAWYFFIINTSKFPIYAVLTALHPDKPMLTVGSLFVNLAVLPLIVVGVFIGKWMLPRISQQAFDAVVLVLAGAAALLKVIGK